MPPRRANVYPTLETSLEQAAREVQAARDAHADAHTRADALEVLHRIVSALEDLRDAEELAVEWWRDLGASWSDVGDVYGITRSAAHQRFRIP